MNDDLDPHFDPSALIPGQFDTKVPRAPRFDSVKDSGERQEFETGSRRDTREGKGRFDLLPPAAILRLARHYENGAKKYGDRNWEKGQPASRFLDSAIRHLFAYLGGARDEDHLAAAAWNALCVIHFEEVGWPEGCDDLEADIGTPAQVPTFPEGYEIEALVPADNDVRWLPTRFGTTDSLDMALARAEAVRAKFPDRAVRILKDGRAVRLILPHEPAVADLG